MNLKKLSFFTCSILCMNSAISEAKKTFPIAKKQEKVTKLETLEQKIAYAKALASTALKQKSTTFGPLAKTTATKSRIIAYSYRSATGATWTLQDSSKLYYGSPDRGGDLESVDILFDSSIAYTKGTTSLINDYYTTQKFDASNNIVSNLEKYWDVSVWINGSQSFFTNTVTKKVATDSSQLWNGSSWDNDSKRKVNYNLANQILNDSNFSWGTSTWENALATTNTYNASGAITKSTISSWFGAMWMVFGTIDYTYDASGYLTQVLSKFINSSFVLENSSRTIFTNDASGKPLIEKTETWNTAGAGSWVNDRQTLNQYDASKQLIVAIAQNWKASASKFDTVNQNRYTYNSYGQLKTEMFDTLNLSTKNWVKRDSSIYYYEDHNPTSIKETTQSNNVKVYPIPTNSEVTIEANLTTAQNIQIVFSDIQGRIVSQINENSGVILNQKISVANIPNGNYILSIIGDKGFSSVQKITIAH